MEESAKKPVNTAVGCLTMIAMLFVIVAIISSCLGGKSSDKPDEAVAPLQLSEMTIEEYAPYLIKETIGEKSNTDKTSLITVTVDDPGMITLDLNASENFTKNTTRQSMLIKSPEIFGMAFADRSELNSITINWYLDLVDLRGNEKVGKVMTITFDRENAETINWENINPENIPLVADQYWEHSLFSK
ncbi:MAG: hypothetical protein GX808_04075 [Syntrophomonadaceae bacterium]|nr:hypothetical protein [Syntrophomonadaceae bacterium]